MPIAQTDWIEFGYEEHGDPAGTPVVLLHGFPDSRRTWDRVVAELAGDRLRLIVPDLRGYGETKILSPDAAGSQEGALGQDALDLADALRLDRFLILGHDWGARAAFAAAVLAPDRLLGLVTLASAYVDYRQRKPMPPAQVQAYWYQWYFNTAEGEKGLAADLVPFCKQLWRAWSPRWAFADVEFDEASAAWHRPEFVGTVLHAYRHRHGNAAGKPRYAKQQAVVDARPKVRVPTWFACGSADACSLPGSGVGQEDWFAAGYERHELPDVGHFVQREAAAAVADLVRRAVKAASVVR